MRSVAMGVRKRASNCWSWRAAVGASVAFAGASCQTVRELKLTSEPSQAEVRLDGKFVGVTPCHVPFEHYGTQRLTMYLAGYRTHSESLELAAPWYLSFPLDVFTEALNPFGFTDEREVHVQLVQGSPILFEPDLTSILLRAEVLRQAGPEGPTTERRR